MRHSMIWCYTKMSVNWQISVSSTMFVAQHLTSLTHVYKNKTICWSMMRLRCMGRHPVWNCRLNGLSLQQQLNIFLKVLFHNTLRLWCRRAQTVMSMRDSDVDLWINSMNSLIFSRPTVALMLQCCVCLSSSVVVCSLWRYVLWLNGAS